MGKVALHFNYFFFAFLCCSVSADEVRICYNYGCHTQVLIKLNEDQLQEVGEMFLNVKNASSERQVVKQAVSLLYLFAGLKIPIWRDKGRDQNDGSVDGQMDCIDHAFTTTAFLQLMEKQGWLKFHHTLEPLQRIRYIFMEHWTARMVELSTRQEYAVDTWYFDHGHPAVIFRMQAWLKGAEPGEVGEE